MTEQIKPDFDALRAQRNATVEASMRRLAEEEGIELKDISSNFDPNACYCACAHDGPCKHQWDGEPYESDDGCLWSATCSRCGLTSFSHSMRFLP